MAATGPVAVSLVFCRQVLKICRSANDPLADRLFAALSIHRLVAGTEPLMVFHMQS